MDGRGTATATAAARVPIRCATRLWYEGHPTQYRYASPMAPTRLETSLYLFLLLCTVATVVKRGVAYPRSDYNPRADLAARKAQP